MTPTLHLRDQGIALSLDHTRVFTFDREGRPYHAMLDGITYLRGLDNTLLKKTRDATGKRQREICSEDQRRQVLDTIWCEATQCLKTLDDLVIDDRRSATLFPPPTLECLEDVIRWSPEKLDNEREHFYSVYNPIGVLPPDQYRSIVVQASEGCSWNRCTFCTLYRDRDFRIKTESELSDHIQRVKSLHGKALADRKSVFIGDANALTIPRYRLHAALRTVAKAFPAQGRALHSFLDIFSSMSKRTDYFRDLHGLGLKKVYIGLETGSEALLRFLDKPVDPQDVVPLVAHLKEAGIQVAVIIMAGIGGRDHASTHRRETTALLSKLPLGVGDQIYISALVASPKMPYLEVAKKAGVEPLPGDQLAEQVAFFRQTLRRLFPSTRVSAYDLAEFIY